MTSGSSTGDPQSTPRPPLLTARAAWGGVVLILIALIAGILLGRIGAPSAAASPGETSAEAGFARDMQTHHNQAVEMSMILRDRSDDAEVRLLALDGVDVERLQDFITKYRQSPNVPEPGALCTQGIDGEGRVS